MSHVYLPTGSDPGSGIYLFSPAIMDWWIDPNGAWYRPYLLWLILIVVTFILQSQRDADEL